MPGACETLNGFNPSDPSDGPTDADGDVYTNAKEYLHPRAAAPLAPWPSGRHNACMAVARSSRSTASRAVEPQGTAAAARAATRSADALGLGAQT